VRLDLHEGESLSSCAWHPSCTAPPAQGVPIMRSSSPVFLVLVGLVLAAFWYDAMVASVGAAHRANGARTAAAPAQ
jgi:hypothetical protein